MLFSFLNISFSLLYDVNMLGDVIPMFGLSDIFVLLNMHIDLLFRLSSVILWRSWLILCLIIFDS